MRGRIGPVLAGPTGRSTWLGSSLLVSALAGVILLAVYGAALGIGAAVSTGDLGLVGETIGASLLRVPEVLVLLAVLVPLLGLAPQAMAVTNTSVLSHLPWHPLGSFAPVATVVLVVLAAALTSLGLYGLRRRDLAAG
ncbi:hypothetical protein [Nonomuraea turcica]|uniref:hypothetical protein n=1 Tax=Nonomuraea sp. G32 TaxID=3067274 RepID=UPI00273C30AB|nr:hypothetical protein [Nonomuraea sp. G32]MDP4509062.1 hypothetical protein [Nonomuraea sp. G32]